MLLTCSFLFVDHTEEVEKERLKQEEETKAKETKERARKEQQEKERTKRKEEKEAVKQRKRNAAFQDVVILDDHIRNDIEKYVLFVGESSKLIAYLCSGQPLSMQEALAHAKRNMVKLTKNLPDEEDAAKLASYMFTPGIQLPHLLSLFLCTHFRVR